MIILKQNESARASHMVIYWCTFGSEKYIYGMYLFTLVSLLSNNQIFT